MMESQSNNDLDWDFYFYVAQTLLGWSREEFFRSTPNHWLKQYIIWLKYNNPDAVKPEKEEGVYYLDQTPFF